MKEDLEWIYMVEYDAGFHARFQRPAGHSIEALILWTMGYLDGLGDGGHEAERETFLDWFFFNSITRNEFQDVITELGLG